MPIYEYVCPDCNLKFELLRPLSRAQEDAVCPRCKCHAKRVFSPFAALSKSESGVTAPVAGSNPCEGCSSTSCDTCGL